jgi:cytochrome c oxidase assembly protein subunit 15
MDLASAQTIGGAEAPPRARDLAAVRAWLVALAVLVVLMVAVGGATRLTGSGLSITEWRPVTGAVPPLTQEAWLAEFAKYRQIPQYELLNRGMSLDEFKFIYWWEWSHRQLGRLIGVIFFLPLVWFWLRGVVRGRLALALLGVGILGGLQGAVGWIMVASGLEPGMTAVAPIRLSLHLTIASLILAALVWIATGLNPSPPVGEGDAGANLRMFAPLSPSPSFPRKRAESRTDLRRGAYVLVALILVQISLGGLVAGSRAGLTYNTWPLMDGRLIPPAATLFAVDPLIENFVDNLALVQFNHRVLALVLVAFALWHALAAWRAAPGSAAARRAGALASLCVAQMVLGIATLVLVVPLWAGLAHQVLAMIVLAAAVFHARRCIH